MKTCKKTLSVILSALMLLSMCGVAFADDCPHENLTHIEANLNPICGQNGNIECWMCNACYQYFADEEKTQPISYEEAYCIPPAYDEHDIQYELGFEEREDRAWLSYPSYYDSYYQQNFGKTMLQYYTDAGYTFWYCGHCGALQRIGAQYGGAMYYSYSALSDIFTLNNAPDGVDPNEGFNLLPTADSDALEAGAYWYDLAGFIDLNLQYADPDDQEMIIAALNSAAFYLSEDGGTLRIVMFGEPEDYDVNDPDNSMYTRFLKQHGVEPVNPNEGFILLPTADSDELEYGAYYFDLYAFAVASSGGPNATEEEIEENMEMLSIYDYYLSEDGNTLRMYSIFGSQDIERNSDAGSYYFTYVRQHGVDPNAGFNLLPTADSDELEDGDYYIDVAGLAAAMSSSEEELAEILQMFSSFEYYLSNDGDTLRIVTPSYTQEFTRDEGEGVYYFMFVRQHGVEPADALEGFDPVAYSTDDIPYGGYLFLLDDYLDDYASSMAGEINYATDEPYTEEEIAAEIAQIREEILATGLYINEAEGKLGMLQPGIPAPMILDLDSEFAAELVEFITYWEPEWVSVKFSADNIAAGDYWMDLESFLGEDASDVDFSEFLVSNRVEVLPNVAAIRVSVAVDDVEEPMVVILAPEGDFAEDYAEWAACIYLTFADSKESTCKVAGYEDAIAITKDGETVILVEGAPLALADHTPGEPVKENDHPATCNDYGSYEMVTYCTACGDELNREPGEYDAYGDHTPGEAAKENDVPSTCNTLGSYDMVVRCTVCGEPLESEHVAYTEYGGHTPGEAVKENDVPSTCKELGSYDMVVRCTVCGEPLESEHYDYTEYGAHKFGDMVREVSATCTAPGVKAHKTCSVCEKNFDADGVEIEDLVIPQRSHTPGEAAKENDVPSTCKVLGSYDWVVRCTECRNVLESEHIAYTEYADHTPKAAVKENDTPSTCEELGSYDSVVYCSVCGDEISRETVDYTEYADHTPGAPVKENEVGASCTAAGSYEEVVYCAVCGDEISRTAKTVAAAGHRWGDWTVIREATEAEDGYREHTCSVCGVTEGETFPANEPHVCNWCGEIHTGFIGFFISIWHSILYIFSRFTGMR